LKVGRKGVDPAQHVESFGFQVRAFFAFQEASPDGPALAECAEHERRRMTAPAAWTRYFEDVDAFICATNFTPPFPQDSRSFAERTIRTPEGERRYEAQPFWIAHASSSSGQPAVSTPLAAPALRRSDHRPLYENDTPITFAELVADEVGGLVAPPV
jgi:amidase